MATPLTSRAGFNTRLDAIQRNIDAREAVLTIAAENAVSALEAVDYTTATAEALATERINFETARATVDLAPATTREAFDARLVTVSEDIEARQTVLTQLENQSAVDAAIVALPNTLPYRNSSATSESPRLNLPSTINGLNVVWSSSNPNRVTNAGVVDRPSNGPAVTETLTATITQGEGNTQGTATASYTVTVPNDNDTDSNFRNGIQYASITVGVKTVN